MMTDKEKRLIQIADTLNEMNAAFGMNVMQNINRLLTIRDALAYFKANNPDLTQFYEKTETKSFNVDMAITDLESYVATLGRYVERFSHLVIEYRKIRNGL